MGLEPTRIRFCRTKSLTKLGLLYAPNFNGADSPIRTDVDFRLVVTNHVQSATMRYRHMDPVMVIETTSTVWKTVILAVELHRVI